MSPDVFDEIAFSRLLARARDGDNSAMGELLQRYRNYLSLLARVQIGRQLQGKLDVADVVQEANLAAHRAIGQFRGSTEAQLLAWLRQILVAILANQVRKFVGTRRRDVTLERELGDHIDQSSAWLGPQLISPQSSPSAQASRREQAVLLADAMEGLPEDYREVIILRQLEGLSFPDVARRMGRTEDSVKNLWARALAKLRRSLNMLEGT
ncbi:sigma-70 family RNA polymerase sigma factor [Aquisphaera giovannonii]|nr:sigma-70 family RNA polymerase sigma factor [Aquisphaera giovannonii]